MSSGGIFTGKGIGPNGKSMVSSVCEAQLTSAGQPAIKKAVTELVTRLGIQANNLWYAAFCTLRASKLT